MTAVKSDTSQKLKAQIMTVTPDQALEWLTDPEYKGPNRRIRKSKVEDYATDIRGGRWHVTGEAIKFDTTGKLLDGQHRLTAVVEADTPIDTLVIFGVEPEAQDVMDTGASRLARDVLSIRGHAVNSALIATGARILVAYKRGNLYPGRQTAKASNGEILDFVQNHPLIEELAAEVAPGVRRVANQGGPLLAAIYLIAEHDRDSAIEFVGKLAAGSDLAAGDPILALRERLLGIKANRERHAPPVMISAIMRCYVAWRRGEQLHRVLLYGKQGAFIPIPDLS